MNKKQINTEVSQITSIQVDGNRTFIEFDTYYISVPKQEVDPDTGEETFRDVLDGKLVMEIPTLDLIETFNTTWTNHAVGKLKHWINQLTK